MIIIMMMILSAILGTAHIVRKVLCVSKLREVAET